MYTFDDLVRSLSVETIDDLLFRGEPLKMDLKRIYGGQILGQAMAAAMRTVEDGQGGGARRPHSLHAYFLRPGDVGRDVIFDVDPIRDGRSFTTRRVVAKQHGRAIFNASVSFQRLESGLEHGAGLPDVSAPESSPPVEEDPNFPHAVIDIRTPFPERVRAPGAHPPEFGYWFRFRGEVGEDPVLHRALLAFISDHFLMSTAMLPHGVSWSTHAVFGASLDHAMWFHADIRVDQWLYYHMESPRAARARGLNFGQVFTRNGVLIASTAQEGLMRVGAARSASA